MTDTRGDEGFERLYQEHHRAVYRFVLGRVRDRQEAEDVTQHAFLEALRALGRGDQPVRPRPWLLAIAENVLRRRRRRMHVQEVPLNELSAVTRAAEVEATAAEIRAALEALPASQREAFVLRELHGMSAAEAAERLGVSAAAVEMLLFRARRGFRAHFESDRRSPLTSLLLLLRAAPESFEPGAVGAAKVAAAAIAIAVAAGAVGSSSSGARQPLPGAGRPAQTVKEPNPAARKKTASPRLVAPVGVRTPTLPESVRQDGDATTPPSEGSPPTAPPAANQGPLPAAPQMTVPSLPVTVPLATVSTPQLTTPAPALPAP